MRKPIAYIKDREVAYIHAIKQEGARSWKTNLGLVPEEGDVPLYEGKDWVGLTDEEILNLYMGITKSAWDCIMYARVIEARLKGMNNGA